MYAIIRGMTDTQQVWLKVYAAAVAAANGCRAVRNADDAVKDFEKRFLSAESVTELRLCEQDSIVLQPNRLYRFTVDPHCIRCRAIARHSSQISELTRP